MKILIEELKTLLNNENIIVEGFRQHSKASEKYVDVTIIQDDGSFTWQGSIPYFYRRTGLLIESPIALAKYLNDIYPYFSKKAIDEFIATETARWLSLIHI